MKPHIYRRNGYWAVDYHWVRRRPDGWGRNVALAQDFARMLNSQMVNRQAL